jgi:hypothetical protein
MAGQEEETSKNIGDLKMNALIEGAHPYGLLLHPSPWRLVGKCHGRPINGVQDHQRG